MDPVAASILAIVGGIASAITIYVSVRAIVRNGVSKRQDPEVEEVVDRIRELTQNVPKQGAKSLKSGQKLLRQDLWGASIPSVSKLSTR